MSINLPITSPYERGHKLMWLEIAGNPDLKKYETKVARDYCYYSKKNLNASCFACQYTKDITDYDSADCRFCPIEWNTLGCSYKGSVYTKFVYMQNINCRLRDSGKDKASRVWLLGIMSRLAIEIANLKWKEVTV